MDVDAAVTVLVEAMQPVADFEDLPLSQVANRILSKNIDAAVALPPFDNSAMDGYALRVGDLPASGVGCLPQSQYITTGSWPEAALTAGTVARIFTGGAIPSGADAVVMQEKCTVTAGGVVIPAGVPVGANIRWQGEDIAVGSLGLVAGTLLRPQEIGLLAALGVARVPVYRRLRVGLFSTGDELVAPGEALAPGKIYDSNRVQIAALAAQMGAEVIDLGRVPDNLEATLSALRNGAEKADLLLSTGGVSVGDADHVKQALQQLGTIDFWRVAIKPGKPLAFGRVAGVPFIGLPGNPASALVTFCILVAPALRRLQGRQQALSPLWLPVPVGFSRHRVNEQRREYLRVRLESHRGETVAIAHNYQGSSSLVSMAWASGLVEVVAGRRFEVGEYLPYLPFSEFLA